MSNEKYNEPGMCHKMANTVSGNTFDLIRVVRHNKKTKMLTGDWLWIADGKLMSRTKSFRFSAPMTFTKHTVVANEEFETMWGVYDV